MALDHDAYSRRMEAFYKDVIALLAQPSTGPSPVVPSPLYPPGQVPDLLIYVGDADPRVADALRLQLPPSVFLLCLYPAWSSDVDAQMRPAAQGRTLVSSMGPESGFADKVSLLVSLLPERNVRLVVASGCREQFPSELRAVEEAIQTAQDNAQQERNRGLIRLRSSLRNLPSIHRHAGLSMVKVPPGTAAIVCGAGPSLLRQLAPLKAAAGRAVIIASGHAAGVLVKSGITPHAVVEVDAHAGRNWPLESRPAALLVACTEVAPEVAERFARVYWCEGSAPVFNLAMRQWNVPLRPTQLGRSVIVPALDFAVRLGCTRIALVGQDLCVAEGGVTHADGEVLQGGDELVELPGNSGQPVASTKNFVAVRTALQAYLRLLKAGVGGQGPRVANCTLGGALVEGAEREPLESFCEGLVPLPDGFQLVESAPLATEAPEKSARLERKFGAYRAIADNLVEMCRKLKKELEQTPLNMTRVQAFQRLLQKLVANEDASRQDSELGMWLQPILLHVDRVMKETPGLMTEENDPFKQLHFLETRFGFMGGLCEDFRRETRRAAERMADPEGGMAAEGSPLAFHGFRENALQQIASSNRSLAAHLRKRGERASPEQFQLRWMNQCVPFIQARLSEGPWVALSGFTSMFERAALEVEQFVQASSFDPARHSLACAIPGNWVHVMEFSKRFPTARLLILEPWVDLLSSLIERGSFLQVLSPQATVLGVDERVPEWRTALEAWREQARSDGLELKIFKLPALAETEEMRRLLEQTGLRA